MAAWDVMDEIRLTSDTQYINFANIPATYRDLVIIGSARNTYNNSYNAATLAMRINDNYANNVYPGGVFYHSGSQGGGASRNDVFAYAGLLCNEHSDTGAHSPIMVHFPNYTDSSNGQTWWSWAGRQPYRTSNSYGLSQHAWGWWTGTAAITNIKFYSEATDYNIKAGSFFTMYGINEL